MKSMYLKVLSLLFLVVLAACKSDDGGDSSPEEDSNAGNNLALGVSAGDLLTGGNFQRMVIEFVYSEGFRPRQETIDAFRTFLNARVNKPGGIVFVETVIDPPAGAPFNATEIREIEANNRTQFNTDDTIAVYVFFSNGSAFGDTQTGFTLGTAYRNTSMVVYEKTLRDVSLDNPDFDLGRLEITTLNHEFGHILGLTNILGDDIHEDHEDGINRKHCIINDCLMYFEAQRSSREMLRQVFRNDEVPQLDELCIADLQAKGGK
ncbi:membrane metalloprotease [Aureitalea marina]|uniref:Membrane metalloprotease n=1 Tax=Aureitalea marina TaxID=930804 RepID=A0A2S7KQD8_9FLAO|nr:membrane metalloprotease [Aureitalea marina]PQB04836.1 hypothetical protein BST85_07960 [Aureitalea marina]